MEITFVSLRGRVYSPTQAMKIVKSRLRRRWGSLLRADWAERVTAAFADHTWLALRNGCTPSALVNDIETSLLGD